MPNKREIIKYEREIEPDADVNDNGYAEKEDDQSAALNSYMDALTEARDSLVCSRIPVFVSPTDSVLNGRIMSLPAGGRTVADAVEEVEARLAVVSASSGLVHPRI